MIDGIVNTLKKSTGSLVHSVAETTGHAVTHATHACDPRQIKDFADRKTVTMVQAFSKALPLFEEAGFTLRSFDVNLGISPKLTPRFMITKVPDAKEREEILKRATGFGATVKPVLIALFKAADLRHYMKMGDLELVGLNVDLAAIPSVRLVFE